MSTQPTGFVIKQLQTQAAKFKQLSDFFEVLLNSSGALETVSFKLKLNKDVFLFNMDGSDNSEIILKKLTQFFADAMDDFYQLQKGKEHQIELLSDSEQDQSLLN